MRTLLTAFVSAAASTPARRKRRELGTIRVTLSGTAESPHIDIESKDVSLDKGRRIGRNTYEVTVFE